jgi:tetratricopeptide (TPR) repeat protein
LIAQAGFYDPSTPKSPLVTSSGPRALPWELFRDQLNETLSIGDPKQNSKQRVKAIARRDQLLALGARATAAELAELGLLQWRLRESQQALETLSRAKGADPRSFWPLANLGSYFQATGQLPEALNHLDAASATFPRPWPNNPTDGEWFRKAEKVQVNLLRARQREAAQRPGRVRAVNEVDALFPVRFVGQSGNFEAGKIADAERAKLPSDAIALVQQLLLWFPEDTRLLWLLGELYNAEGDIRTAEQVFDDCVGPRNFQSETLREHRRIVKDAVAAIPPPEPPPPAESFLPDASTLWIVGGIGGALIAILVLLQSRELYRRMMRRSDS